MRKNLEIIYDDVETICNLIYKIADAGIDYYENDGINNSEIDYIDILFNTYIYMFTEDGLYLELYLYELDTEDLQTLKNAVKCEYDAENIIMIAVFDDIENTFKTNYSKFTIENIGRVNDGDIMYLNWEYIRDSFTPITNRNLAQTLSQGFTPDMVNNLENWKYD